MESCRQNKDTQNGSNHPNSHRYQLFFPQLDHCKLSCLVRVLRIPVIEVGGLWRIGVGVVRFTIIVETRRLIRIRISHRQEEGSVLGARPVDASLTGGGETEV